MKKSLFGGVGSRSMRNFSRSCGDCFAGSGRVSENASSPAETVADAASLTANIKRIAVEYLEHSVTNKDDPNYPDSYNADEQHNISGL